MSKNDKKGIEEKAEKFLAEYQEKYSTAISDAREAAATTATPAWQSNYLAQVAAHDKCVRDLASTISNAGKRIADFDTDEENEKEVKDAVKGLQDERIRHQAWRNRTISPYESRANRCAEILETTRREAQRLEQAEGLIWHGLTSEVVKITGKWPVAEWSEGAGIVTVTEQSSGEQKQTGT